MYRWKGYSYKQWLSQKEIQKFFWGSHDTVFHKAVVRIGPEECCKTAVYLRTCNYQPHATRRQHLHTFPGTSGRGKVVDNAAVHHAHLRNQGADGK